MKGVNVMKSLHTSTTTTQLHYYIGELYNFCINRVFNPFLDVQTDDTEILISETLAKRFQDGKLAKKGNVYVTKTMN